MFLTNTIFDHNIFDFLSDEFLFNSSVKDMSPAAFYKKDSDFIIEAKTLGVSPDDVNVKLESDVLSVTGETKNEYSDKSFNVQIKVRIGQDILKNVEKIDYTSKNGITYVILKMKKISNSPVKISKI